MPVVPQRRNYSQNLYQTSRTPVVDSDVNTMIADAAQQRDRNMMTDYQRRLVTAPMAPQPSMPQRRQLSVSPDGRQYIPSPGTDGSFDAARYREGEILGGHRDGTPYANGGVVKVVRSPSGGIGLKGYGTPPVHTPDMLANEEAYSNRMQDYRVRLRDMRALRAFRGNQQLANAPAVIEALARNKLRGAVPGGVLFDGRGTVVGPNGMRLPHVADGVLPGPVGPDGKPTTRGLVTALTGRPEDLVVPPPQEQQASSYYDGLLSTLGTAAAIGGAGYWLGKRGRQPAVSPAQPSAAQSAALSQGGIRQGYDVTADAGRVASQADMPSRPMPRSSISGTMSPRDEEVLREWFRRQQAQAQQPNPMDAFREPVSAPRSANVDMPQTRSPAPLQGEWLPRLNTVASPPIIDAEYEVRGTRPLNRTGLPAGISTPVEGDLLPPSPAPQRVMEGEFDPRTFSLNRTDLPSRINPSGMMEQMPSPSQYRRGLLPGPEYPAFTAQQLPLRRPYMPSAYAPEVGGGGTIQPPVPLQAQSQPPRRANPFMSPEQAQAFEQEVMRIRQNQSQLPSEDIATIRDMTGNSQSRLSALEPVGRDVFDAGMEIDAAQSTGQHGGTRANSGRKMERISYDDISRAVKHSPDPAFKQKWNGILGLMKQAGAKDMPATPDVIEAHKFAMGQEKLNETATQRMARIDAERQKYFDQQNVGTTPQTPDVSTREAKIAEYAKLYGPKQMEKFSPEVQAQMFDGTPLTKAEMRQFENLHKSAKAKGSVMKLPNGIGKGIKGVGPIMDIWGLLSDPLFELLRPKAYQQELEDRYNEARDPTSAGYRGA